MSFSIGDKVVCVDAKDLIPYPDDTDPAEGQVYVVSNVVHLAQYKQNPIRIFLIGCSNMAIIDEFGTTANHGYKARRFRKLDEIKDELASLIGQPQQETA